MKPILTAIVGAAVAASLAANGFAQPPAGPNSLGQDWRPQQNEVRQGVDGGRLVPLAQVITQLSQRMGGRLLDSGLEYQAGKPIYRIRWMTRDGRRVDLLVDATTGGIVSGG
jgi:uncharacterized membrane protein YkoI